MSFERPDPDSHKTVTDTELNEALENDHIDPSMLDADRIDHDEGQRAPGPVDDENRRPPREQDVTTGEAGKPIEPPD
jgi:hypothetical protein